MSEQISSGEGAKPPNETQARSAKRVRKLSGAERAALSELAFAMYQVAAAEMPSDSKWHMLRAKLLAWRARYI